MTTKKEEADDQVMDVTVVEEKVGGMQKMVEETKVTNDDELGAVSDKIKNIKELGKFIRQEMEVYTKPASQIVRAAQAKFLPYEKECKAAEAGLKTKASVYMTEVEAKRLKKEESIAKQVDSGHIKEETGLKKMEAVGEEKKSASTGRSKLTQKMVPEATIVNPDLVPKEYWIIDEARVKKAAIAGAVIPGVEVKKVPQMMSGR